MKKLICLLFGHKKRPVVRYETGVFLYYRCVRCGKINKEGNAD